MHPDVKIYTLSTCSHCKTLKKFLDDCDVKYDFTDVDTLSGEERDIALKEVARINPRRSFPIIIISNKVIVGFQEAEIKKALGQ